MGKLDGKVAVITGGTSGMALAGAKLFVEERCARFITGRRQDALDEAVKEIGRNVTGVQGDAANLDDLDRLYDIVKREKGTIDVLWASAGGGEATQSLGMRPLDVGGLTMAHWLEGAGVITVGLANHGGREPRLRSQHHRALRLRWERSSDRCIA